MKYNKNAGTVLFLLLFTTGQREKNIEKTLSVSAGVQKRWKKRVLRILYRSIYRILKIDFQNNLNLHKVYLSYFQLTKKLKRFY